MLREMKALNIIWFPALLTLLSACVKEEIFPESKVVEGIPTEVTLSYSVDDAEIITRAAQESRYEYRVENMYIFIFDASGNRISLESGSSFFTLDAGLSVENGDASSSGKVQFSVKSANDARIIGVANLTTSETSTAYNVSASDLDKINTLDELRNLVINARQESIERGGLFLMAGYAVAGDVQSDEDVSLSDERTKIDIVSEAGGGTLDCTLRLKRVDAKIEVKVSSSPSNADWKDFSFEPKTWRVMQVPKQSLLLESEISDYARTSDADGDGCSYYDTDERVFEVMDQFEDGDNNVYYRGGSFVFYMPENRKGYKQQITETDKDKAYALRDESNTADFDGSAVGRPGQKYENTDFMYAADNSTYLILTGHMSYIDTKNYNINADVRFIIHLGYASGDANDYYTRRNGHYTYNVTVTGLDNVIVEVTNENESGNSEVRPGYEGDIVYSNNVIFNLDSHYDRTLLEISPDIINDKLTWGVKTPFSSGIHAPGSPDYSGVEDYKWIKFAINTEYGYGHGQYVKYPGDQNYDDPAKDDDGKSSPSYSSYPNARLRDIDQLVNYLKDVKNGNVTGVTIDDLIPDNVPSDNRHICITAFVDENLYYVNPVNGETGDENRSLWKSSVEKEDRQMHIITGDVHYSEDGNSSVVNSLYTFSQRAIRTIFNVDKEELTTAWGLESVMETKRLPVGEGVITSSASSESNGRTNTLTWMRGKSWTQVLNTSDQYGLNSGYENAAYACLMRNRDLNGDNKIDDNEIRWYLASINQLTDIYLGEYALDAESRLYPRNSADRPGAQGPDGVYWHYTSSSYNPSDKAPWVLWAEEGASKGSYGGQYGSYALNGGNYSYRCVRNLGLSLANEEEIPEDLVDVIDNEDGTYTLDITNMSEKSRRTNLEIVPLPNHPETSANNRPYAKFVVAAETIPSPSSYPINGDYTYTMGQSTEGDTDVGWGNANTWQYYQSQQNDDCPPTYRIPNQRELMIMASRLPDSFWNDDERTERVTWHEGVGGALSRKESKDLTKKPYYICQTSFSLNGKPPYDEMENGLYYKREGFLWNADNNVFMLQNNRTERGYVRCVKDID